jgi:hypothetical protein
VKRKGQVHFHINWKKVAAKEKYHQTKFIKRQPTLLLLTMLWALMLRKTKLIVAVADQGLLETIYDQLKPKIKKCTIVLKTEQNSRC